MAVTFFLFLALFFLVYYAVTFIEEEFEDTQYDDYEFDNLTSIPDEALVYYNDTISEEFSEYEESSNVIMTTEHTT